MPYTIVADSKKDIQLLYLRPEEANERRPRAIMDKKGSEKAI